MNLLIQILQALLMVGKFIIRHKAYTFNFLVIRLTFKLEKITLK